MKITIKFCSSIDPTVLELATAYDFAALNDQFLFDQSTRTLYVGIAYKPHPIDCSDYDQTLYYPLGLKTLKQIPQKTTEISIVSNGLTTKQLESYRLGLKTSFYKYSYHDGVKIADIKVTVDQKVDNQVDCILSGIILTKSLLDQDSYRLNPSSYVEVLKKEFGNLPSFATLKIIDNKEIINLSMNMLAGVGRGSEHGSYVVSVELEAKEPNSPTLAFVGKGLTFDTGGVNIKEDGGSFGMHNDMGGSGTIFGLLKACLEHGQPKNKNLVFVAGIVENVTDGKSYHSGEVLANMVGQTAIIKNTDAEGRLTLADVVPYTIVNYKPTEVFTLATLTGAAIGAFTATSAPIFSTKKALRDKVYDFFLKNEEEAISVSLPSKAYSVGTKDSTGVADMSNIGTYPTFHGIRVAGSQTAAAFVMASAQPQLWKKHKEDLPESINTVHIDIAGAVVDNKGFGTGYGIRALFDYINNG
jgi:leucyl aminopeptidase